MNIDPQLDDKAFYIGNLIHELGRLQEQKFDELWIECKEKEWIKGMDEADAQQWLFDYCFNGQYQSGESKHYDEHFSEYIDNTI